MTIGPKGQKRPLDVVGCAVMVAKIATGEEEETEEKSGRVRSGKAGAEARLKELTPEERSEIARLAAESRCKKSDT